MNPAVPAPSVRASISRDGAVLMDVRQGIVFSLNLTGSKVWSQLAEGRSVEDIADNLRKEYDITREQALADTQDLIRHLEEKHLLVRSR